MCAAAAPAVACGSGTRQLRQMLRVAHAEDVDREQGGDEHAEDLVGAVERVQDFFFFNLKVFIKE